MPISLGDAVLVFKGDQTDLDAAFASVPPKAKASFGAASDFVGQFNDELDATGDNVRFAGEKIMSLTEAFKTLSISGPERLKQRLDDARAAFATLADAGVTAKGTLLQASIKVIERELAYRKALGDSTAELTKQLETAQKKYADLGGSAAPVKKITEGFHEARGAVDLFAESLGVSIPRELKAVISQLPGVSAALEAAFSGAAILAVAALLVELVNKIAEFRQKQRDLAQGWEDYRLGAVEAFNDATNKIIEQKAQLIEMTQGPLAALDFKLAHLHETSSATFDLMTKQVKELGAQMEKAGTSTIFHPDRAAAKEALDDLLIQFTRIRREAEHAFPDDPLKSYREQLALTDTKIAELQAKIASYRRGLGEGTAEDIKLNEKFLAPLTDQLELLQNINREIKQRIQSDENENKILAQQRALAAATKDVQEAADVRQQQLAAVELFRAKQHEAFVSGQIDAAAWAAAQIKATQMAAGAQEQYDKAVVTSYQKAGDAEKTKQAQVQLTTDRTLDAAKAIEARLTASAAAAEGLIQAAHGRLLQQLADIEMFKAQQHAAFNAGQIDAASWAVAQRRAADQVIAAQEQYLQRQIQIYQQTGQTQKAAQLQIQATADETLNAAKALDALTTASEAHHTAMLKVFQDWQNMLNVNIAKTWEETVRSAEKLEKALNDLHKAQTNLAEQRITINTEQQIQAIKDLAEDGVISQGEANQQLRELYTQAEHDQLQSLEVLKDQQQTRVDELKAQIEANADNPLFTEAQLNHLKELLAQAEVQITDTQGRIESAQATADAKIAALDRTTLGRGITTWNQYFKAIIDGSLRSGFAVARFAQLMVVNLQQAGEAAISGSQTFAEAARAMLKSMLMAFAGEAAARAARQLGYAFEDLATPGMEGHAITHFLSAAKWGALAAALDIAAAFSGGSAGTSGGGGSPAAPQNLPPTPATIANPNPPPPPTIASILHLARGGLVSAPTLAIVGDSVRSSQGGATEAVLPLDSPQAMQTIAGALVEHLGGGIVQHFHFKGDLIDYTQLMRRQSRMVKKGFARQSASEATRIIRTA